MPTTKTIKKLSLDGGQTLYNLKDEVARDSVGTLSNLTTEVKTDLVTAVNEVNSKVNNELRVLSYLDEKLQIGVVVNTINVQESNGKLMLSIGGTTQAVDSPVNDEFIDENI